MRVNEPDWLFLLRIVLLVLRVEGNMKRRRSRSIAFHGPLFSPLMDPPRGGGSPPPPRHAGKVGAARGESRTVRRTKRRGEADRLTKTHHLVNSKHKRVCFWVLFWISISKKSSCAGNRGWMAPTFARPWTTPRFREETALRVIRLALCVEPIVSPKWVLSRRDHTPKQEEQLECSRELVFFFFFFHPFLISRLHSEAPAVRPAN